MRKIEKLLLELKDWANGERPIDNVVLGVEGGRGVMMNRIFNSERGAKDVKGQGLGGYSNSYARYRQSLGRQTKVVDLSLTESLFKDIKLVRNGKKITIAIPSVAERQKVRWIEERYKKNIFDLSASEKENVKKSIKRSMDEDVNTIINEYLG